MYLGWGGRDQEHNEAVKRFKELAESDGEHQAIAMYMVGICYTNGRGVAKDEAKAVEWYEKAAEKGDSGAMNNLGNCYRNGYGVDKDEAKAFEWYDKATEKGHSMAMSNAGACYKNGWGVAKDVAKAREWFTKAVALGNANAATWLASLSA